MSRNAQKPSTAQTKASTQNAKKHKRKAEFLDYAGGPSARYLVLVGVSILLAIGLLMSFSASSGEAVINEINRQGASVVTSGKATTSFAELFGGLKLSSFKSGIQQLVFLIVGALIAFIISRIDYHYFIRFALPLALVVGIGLIAVFFFPAMGGAHRWIFVAGTSIQPSEFVKPILLVIGAGTFAALRTKLAAGKRPQVGDWIRPALIIALMLVLVLFEPDTGTTLIILVGLVSAWLFCDLPWKIPALFVGAGGVVYAIRLLFSGSDNYGMRRITDFFTTWTTGKTAYQTLQAQYALAGGGITGVGPGLSRQKYMWLTQAQSDFILAVVGEELGLIGILLILIAFALILIFGMIIASRAKDRLGRALAGGSVMLLVFQAILNIYAVSSLIPVTGKPLPFVTAGGTSMITSMALVGIIMSVSRYATGRRMREMKRPRSHLSLVMGGEEATSTPQRGAGTRPKAQKKSGGSNRSSSGGKGGNAAAHKRPPKKQGSKRGRARIPEEEGKDEDDLEWRWDSGAHLSGSGSRR